MDSLHAIRVEADGEGLRIAWDAGYTAGPVDLYAGPAPEVFDLARPLLRGARGEARLGPDWAHPRHYFRLVPADAEPLVVARRDVPLDGCVNFRDLGGYRAADGRRVRWGRLFRSGHMANLSERGKQDFAALDIRAVCDFRLAEERASENAELPGAPPIATIGIPPGVGDREYFHRVFASTDDPRVVLEAVHETMRSIVLDAGARYARMFEVLLEREDGAVLLNCSAGKERTGIGSALVLEALGVPRDTILADFMLSRRYFPATSEIPRVREKYAVRARDDAQATALIMPLLETHESYLAAAFAAIDERRAGVTAFLAEVCGVGPAELRRLRELYTV
jgi:protein-tyrosine phosphatase